MRRHSDRDPHPDSPRNLRLDAGLKLRQVADLLGTSVSVVHRVERGRANPTAATLAAYYAACGRADLFGPLLTVLDDTHTGRILAVYEAWEARFRPGSPSARSSSV